MGDVSPLPQRKRIIKGILEPDEGLSYERDSYHNSERQLA